MLLNEEISLMSVRVLLNIFLRRDFAFFVIYLVIFHAIQSDPRWGQVSSRKQSECGRHGLSNILKLQATFLNSIYHQRAGKNNLFHMRGGRFYAGNTLCAFKKC